VAAGLSALSQPTSAHQRFRARAREAVGLRLESGRNGITRQVLANGLRAVVVGRDGLAYSPPRWHESATFRSGGQTNLLIADNRTRQYEQAGEDERAKLEQMAWGTTETQTPG
jgi:hypothetical protein